MCAIFILYVRVIFFVCVFFFTPYGPVCMEGGGEGIFVVAPLP